MAIQSGDPIPNATFTVMAPDGPDLRTTDQIFKGHKVVLFAVAGAFTPVCDKHHLPGFLANLDQFKARGVDEVASKRGAPFLPCRTFEAVPICEKVSYRIPLVPNARRFRAGHKLRLYLTTDDQNKDVPAPLEFRHASVGTSSFNMVFSSSRLLLPVAK